MTSLWCRFPQERNRRTQRDRAQAASTWQKATATGADSRASPGSLGSVRHSDDHRVSAFWRSNSRRAIAASSSWPRLKEPDPTVRLRHHDLVASVGRSNPTAVHIAKHMAPIPPAERNAPHNALAERRQCRGHPRWMLLLSRSKAKSAGAQKCPNTILPFDKTKDPTLSRRALGALSLGAGAAVTASAVAAGSVVETDVVIRMADGNCDAALFYPLGSGSWPGAVIFADELGLRPAFRDMGRRLALEGYTVLVPNPFYRTRVAPVLSGPFDFSKPEDRAKLAELTAP